MKKIGRVLILTLICGIIVVAIITSTTKTTPISEKIWVNNHEQLHVGYFDNYAPYSSTGNDFREKGLFSDILKYIAEQISTFFPTSMDMGDKTNYWGDQE